MQRFSILPPNKIFLCVKLDYHNYLVWHEKFPCCIMANRDEGFINRFLGKPSPLLDFKGLTPNSHYMTWMQNDSLIKSWISNFVLHYMNAILVGNLSAQEQWMTLYTRFSNIIQSVIMKLRSRWKTLNKNVYLVTNYLLYAKIISNHLVSASKVVSNKELVLYILNGLRLRYFSFVTTFNITHLRPFVRVLHTQLESYKRMMLVSKGTTQDSLFLVMV